MRLTELRRVLKLKGLTALKLSYSQVMNWDVVGNVTSNYEDHVLHVTVSELDLDVINAAKILESPHDALRLVLQSVEQAGMCSRLIYAAKRYITGETDVQKPEVQTG